jgi:hypothetical protein
MKAAVPGTVTPEAMSESAWIADKVPPGVTPEATPKVARNALAAPEIVPPVLTDIEMCAPLIVPPAAAPAPVTTEKARNVSPEPVLVKAKRSYDKRVSPVVAEVEP